jgi:SAM-dependent methyltransferase
VTAGESEARKTDSGAIHGAADDTEAREYTDRLVRLQHKWWKRLLPVQAPYRWNIRRLRPGFVLDIGCGIGRSLLHLDGQGVGVDHNVASVEVCRRLGLEAYTPAEFRASPHYSPEKFDTLLLSHVAEHMTVAEAVELLNSYLPVLKGGGKVIIITPQERGYRGDASHVQFMDFAAVRAVMEGCGLGVERQYSFPFPRALGRVFVYNEFVSVGRLRHIHR